MKRPFCFNLFIASPGDVSKERKVMDDLCRQWNSTWGEEKNARIEAIRWEKDLTVDSRKKAQKLINEQLISKCDILFAIFGKRYGTPTSYYDSGTIEEINQVIKKGKPVIIYFMQHNYLLDELDSSQVKKIKTLKKRLQEKGSYRNLKNVKELKDFFPQDINVHISALLKDTVNELPIDFRGISTIKKESSNRSEKENWYEQSISELINKYLEENNHSFAVYKRGITFTENLLLWKSLSGVNYDALRRIGINAREFSFNKKYGNYDYSKDLRARYPNWNTEISQILKEFQATENRKVIGIASNYGKELNEIFTDDIFKNNKLDALDLSNDAIKRGQKAFKDITFHKGDMEESPLKNGSYDIYLNLRSIHSSGIDYKLVIADCYRILKPGGVAIISISNGYLTPKKPGSKEYFEVPGLYDNRTETFSKHRPFELARKIWSKLNDYGFNNTAIKTGKTEIFVYAIK